MKESYFITGTDTDVGKTWVACRLLQRAARAGKHTLGLKPVAAGAVLSSDGLRNDDALLLQHASSVQLPYANTNPFCFEPAIAPHLAAQQANTTLTAHAVAAAVQNSIAHSAANYVLIEGAGGWRVPINDTESLADVARLLGAPVILVVGMRLGCLNHALLTAEAIRADGLALAGWVANDLGEAMPWLEDNIAALEQRLPAPRIRLD